MTPDEETIRKWLAEDQYEIKVIDLVVIGFRPFSYFDILLCGVYRAIWYPYSLILRMTGDGRQLQLSENEAARLHEAVMNYLWRETEC